MKVRYSPRALADLDAIHAYLDDRSPAGALRVITVIRRLIDGLADFPDAGGETDLTGVRTLLAGRFPYRIFYRLRRDEIEVLHVRHTSRHGSIGDD